MQPDTIINLVAGGALAAFLARLLQQQYEARIADYKERIKEQSSLLADMTKGFDGVGDKLDDNKRTLDRIAGMSPKSAGGSS